MAKKVYCKFCKYRVWYDSSFCYPFDIGNYFSPEAHSDINAKVMPICNSDNDCKYYKHQITIHDIPPSTNKVERYHWAKRQQLKNEWAEIVYYAWIEAGKTKYNDKVSVQITYFFKDKRQRDKDNYAGKWLLDGLKGHAFSDDNYKIVNLPEPIFEYDKENPRTVIEIKEIG